MINLATDENYAVTFDDLAIRNISINPIFIFKLLKI